jgi:hypothetical protein
LPEISVHHHSVSRKNEGSPDMSWPDIMQRVLPPIGGVLPHITSPFGEVEGRPPGSTKPHRAVDFNYLGGQTGINLKHPALRSPVAGVVTEAGGDKYGTITIRDANGYSHSILHTHSQHVTVGDPVAEGQLIGTMGNTGTKQQHVHYQLRDPGGEIVNPTAFWDRQGSVDPNPSPPAHVQEYQQYLQGLGVNAGNGFGNAPGAAGVPTAPLVPPNGVRPSDRSDSFGARFGNWASSPVAISPPPPSDRPESLDNRFGNWGSVPAGGLGDADSPLLRPPEKYRRSTAPDGSRPVDLAQPLAPTNVSGPDFGSRPADELYAARERAARLLAGAGRYIENALIPSAQAVSPSGPMSSSPMTGANGYQPPIRRLVGQIVDDPRASAFNTGAPATPSPSNGFLPSDRGDLFGGRFGSRASTGAGDSPQATPDSAPYSEMFLHYLNQLTPGQSQAPASSSNINAPTPYQPVSPIFAPPDYSPATANGSVENWIASLAGVDPDDPTQFPVPPIFSPLYRR